MTNRFTLLAAAAALALPATMAGAQTSHSATPSAGPATHTQMPAPATPPASANTATEDAQAAETTSSATQPAEPGAQPSATAQTATPPTQGAAEPAGGPVRLATAADLHAGVQVHDQQGGMVGTVESADAAGAVVATGTVRARLSLASFGANSQGLVIAMTRSQLNAAAAHTAPQPRAG